MIEPSPKSSFLREILNASGPPRNPELTDYNSAGTGSLDRYVVDNYILEEDPENEIDSDERP